MSLDDEARGAVTHNAVSIHLLSTFEKDRELWRMVISLHKYGVIYLVSRSDCIAYYPIASANTAATTAVDYFFTFNHNAIRAINYSASTPG
jgi:hypothetical protein